MALDCFAPFYRTVPCAVHWKSTEAVHVRPWFPIFSNLILGFQYVLAGIFVRISPFHARIRTYSLSDYTRGPHRGFERWPGSRSLG